MKEKYVLTSLLTNASKSFDHYLLLVCSRQYGIYTLIKKKEEGNKFGKDNPWLQYHPPYRYVVSAEAGVSRKKWEEDVRAYIKKFKEDARKLDPSATFKLGESDQIYFKTP